MLAVDLVYFFFRQAFHRLSDFAEELRQGLQARKLKTSSRCAQLDSQAARSNGASWCGFPLPWASRHRWRKNRWNISVNTRGVSALNSFGLELQYISTLCGIRNSPSNFKVRPLTQRHPATGPWKHHGTSARATLRWGTDCQWQLTLRPEIGELQQVKYWRSEGTIE